MIGLDSGQVARPAPCCNPIPGERIVGIAVRGKGVMIHAIDCAELVAFEDAPDRWIDLRWAEGQAQPDHAARIEVTMANDAGVLGRICTLIGEQRANITDIVFTERKPDFYRMVIDIEVRDMEHLTHVLTAIDADFGRGAGAAVPAGAGGGERARPRAECVRRRPPGGGEAIRVHGLQATRQAAPPQPDPRGAATRGAAGGAASSISGHRVRRLPDTPHRIALGFACGVFVSFTPFFGHPHPAPPRRSPGWCAAT